MRYGTGRVTLGEVWDRSADAPGGPERVGRPFGRSVMGTTGRSGTSRVTLKEVRGGSGTLPEVQAGSGNTSEGPGRLGGHMGRSGTGRGALPEIRNGSGDSLQGPGRVGNI